MDTAITPKQIVEATGISMPYASQILSGSRTGVSSEIALTIFRAFGLRVGVLADLTDDDIEKMCAEREASKCISPTPPSPAAEVPGGGKGPPAHGPAAGDSNDDREAA